MSAGDILNNIQSNVSNFGNDLIKTNPSIPPTVTCKRGAIQLEELVGKADWTGFGAALTKFQSEVKNLVEKAKMEGTTIT